MRVIGILHFPDDVPAPCLARVLVRVEDASLADVPSVAVAGQEIPGVEVCPRATAAFDFDAGALQPGRRYVVRAHASCSGDGAVRPGDYVSTQSHPLSPDSLLQAPLRIPLRRVE